MARETPLPLLPSIRCPLYLATKLLLSICFRTARKTELTILLAMLSVSVKLLAAILTRFCAIPCDVSIRRRTHIVTIAVTGRFDISVTACYPGLPGTLRYNSS